MFRTATALALTALLSGSAFAQNAPGSTSTTQSQGSLEGTQQPLPQRIQQKLTAQGFTDIKVVPRATS